jgi:peptidoglycan/LPS O-acetylase OafA/YrhL
MSTTPKQGNSSFRGDLEGLRAVAVILVVLYHAGISGFGGGFVGVDLFFVLSGYFITSQLWSELKNTGKVSLRNFYARRARRILPTASLVILVTALVALFVCSPVYFGQFGIDALSATFNFANIRFFQSSNDYFDPISRNSPFIHFWSLSVEEQFYLVWPILFVVLALLIAKRWRKDQSSLSIKLRLSGMMAALIAGSLALSIWQMQANQTAAFYLLPSRAWELGLGGLVAVLSTPRKLPRLLATALEVLAVTTLTVIVVAYNDSTPFPGLAALPPVLAGLLFVLTGPSGGAFTRLMATPPFRAIGRWSFALYLWHWPVLVFLDQVLADRSNVKIRFFFMLIALVLAAVTYGFFENPIRYWRMLQVSLTKTLAFAVAAVALAALAASPMVVASSLGGTTQINVDANVRSVTREVQRALSVNKLPANITPALAAAKDLSHTKTYGTGCMADFQEDVFPACVYGDSKSKFTVWLVGDSHANHWFPAIDAIALKYHLKLILHTRSGCPLLDITLPLRNTNQPYELCTKWTRQVIGGLKKAHPNLLITAGTLPIVGFHPQSYGRRLAEVKRYADQTVVLGDTPHSNLDTPLCVAAHPKHISTCNMLRYPPGGADWQNLDSQVSSVVSKLDLPYIETAKWVCVGNHCPVIVGNVLLYRDQSHLTTPGATLLTPFMEAALRQYLPKLK